jgi:hypothetical protein
MASVPRFLICVHLRLSAVVFLLIRHFQMEWLNGKAHWRGGRQERRRKRVLHPKAPGGLAHSKTLSRLHAPFVEIRQVFDCGSPLPLSTSQTRSGRCSQRVSEASKMKSIYEIPS